jgi:hypothetical protein
MLLYQTTQFEKKDLKIRMISYIVKNEEDGVTFRHDILYVDDVDQSLVVPRKWE